MCHMDYKYCVRLLVGCVAGCLVTVSPVAAQTTADSQRALLIDQILILQSQIATLQQQLALQAKNQESGILGEIDGEVLSSYTVYEQEISSRAPQAYQDYFQRLLQILPDEYDNHIDEFVIFTDSTAEVDALVETKTPYTKNWLYAVRDNEVKEDPQSKASTELMIHEFAHIFSLDQVFREGGVAANCHSYFNDSICYENDTYLGEFIDTFWSPQMLDELHLVQRGSRLTQDEFYQKYRSYFVSDYAATDPAEDFAESFTWYVYGRIADKGSIADQKIEFFDRFSYTQALADEINTNL